MTDSRSNGNPTNRESNKARRRILTVTTAGIGAVGVAGLMVPFIASLKPSELSKAGAQPIRVDVSALKPRERIVAIWQNKPVWIIRRDRQMIQRLKEDNARLSDPQSVDSQQPEFARNTLRSLKPDLLIVIGLCTHLSCIPNYHPEFGTTQFDAQWQGGFFCSCHGSKFDLAGRVYNQAPAPRNLIVPPHHFISEHVIIIGKSAEEKA